jgi:hypothetical protein
MKRPKSIHVMILIVVFSILNAACAFSLDLGGAAGTSQPPTTDAPSAAQPTSEQKGAADADAPANALPPETGSINGKLSYPSEFIPPLRVVAFHVENGSWTQKYAYVDTMLNASSYQIDGLEPGFYWVTAYTISNDNGAPSGLAGGYTQAVLCGLSVDCTDHSLIAVEVKPGIVAGNIDPGDWYAAEGSFLANPAP